MKKIINIDSIIYICCGIITLIALVAIGLCIGMNRNYNTMRQLYLADEDIIDDLNSREYQKTQQRDICFRRLIVCMKDMNYIANSSTEITKDVLKDVTLKSCQTRTAYMLYQNMSYVKDFVSYINLQR